jgi:oligopeptide transport system permease protein
LIQELKLEVSKEKDMNNENFTFVDSSEKLDNEQIRPSLTYWQDVWRRLKKNKLAIMGLSGVILIILFAVFGPLFRPFLYSDQDLRFKNIPPRVEIYQLSEDRYVYLSQDYHLIAVSAEGEMLDKYDRVSSDAINRVYTYALESDGLEVELDFSNRVKANSGKEVPYEFMFTFEGNESTEVFDKVGNKTYVLGTDALGRDLLTRVMYGARISLIVAGVAAVINLFIGVVYGSISGFFGGSVDLFMMRIVDIINSIPLLLYVILLLVVLDDRGLGTIILALITVYWVGMARLVRGQTLGIKNQEYVLAARTIGVKNLRIISKHIIPNALGPIIVSLTMMVPSAVFTEAFLSFIGLGVSAPQASLGTLASDGAQLIRVFPYQLIWPALTIAWMMLSFNFLGDGLRDALDPRLRKG